MSGAASFGAASPPGAGRSIDLTWPGRLALRSANGAAVGAIASYGRASGGVSIDNTSSQQFTGLGAATWATGAGYNGRAGIAFVPGAGAANTGVYQTLDNMVITPSFGAQAVNGDASDTDDAACFRCFAMIAFEDHVSYNDIGIAWATANGGAYGIQASGSSGFGFALTAAGQVSFVRRSAIGGPGVLTTTPIANVGFAQWNSYEVRVIGATAVRNAKLTALFNGVPKLTLDWIVDGLPNPLHSNNVYGFQTVLVDHGSGGAGQMVVNRVKFFAGPTEASLL